MKLPKTDSIYTRSEIEGQPQLWRDTIQLLTSNPSIREFVKPLDEKGNLNVILTGAGSSAFIGAAVEPVYNRLPGVTSRAVSTTTLVTHCESYIDPDTPLVLISFARSGNSPESIAAVDAIDAHCKETWHIALTCNKDGQLATKVREMDHGLAVLLPDAADDKGLAMTGSFTSMMLSAIYLAEVLNRTDEEQIALVNRIAASAEEVISETTPCIKELVQKKFDRIVFLGSGPLLAVAREGHLKVQELTDGIVVGKFDSFLGFRHGPKAVVNKNTVLVFLFSHDPDVFRYEKDLVDEILSEGVAMSCIGIYSDKEQAKQLDLDLSIVYDLDGETRDSDLYITPYALPSQLIGLYKSMELGLDPDSPSRNNAISRVVKGVTIYS